jgi:hypothetical protein
MEACVGADHLRAGGGVVQVGPGEGAGQAIGTHRRHAKAGAWAEEKLPAIDPHPIRFGRQHHRPERLAGERRVQQRATSFSLAEQEMLRLEHRHGRRGVSPRPAVRSARRLAA